MNISIFEQFIQFNMTCHGGGIAMTMTCAEYSPVITLLKYSCATLYTLRKLCQANNQNFDTAIVWCQVSLGVHDFMSEMELHRFVKKKCEIHTLKVAWILLSDMNIFTSTLKVYCRNQCILFVRLSDISVSEAYFAKLCHSFTCLDYQLFD